jgi:hypothetical protein
MENRIFNYLEVVLRFTLVGTLIANRYDLSDLIIQAYGLNVMYEVGLTAATRRPAGLM